MGPYLNGILTGMLLVFSFLFISGFDLNPKQKYVSQSEYHNAIQTIINYQNFDNKLLQVHSQKTRARFNRIIAYIEQKYGDDLSLTKEFIDMREEKN